MEIENKQEWKICKNNLSEEDPCGICHLASSGKTVFHKCANGVNHVYHKACMKAWYETAGSRQTCPTCEEQISYGDLKGRYQDLAEKFEKWNYPQADQVENLKKGFTIAFVATGVTAVVAGVTAVAAGTVTKIAEATALAGIATVTATLGFGPSLEQGRGMIETATTALEVGILTVALGAEGARVVRKGIIEAQEVADLAVVGLAMVGLAIAGIKGEGLTGRATESLARRIVKWMKE